MIRERNEWRASGDYYAAMVRLGFNTAAAISVVLFLAAMLLLVSGQEGHHVLHDGGGGIAGGSKIATVAIFKEKGAIGIGWTYTCVRFDRSIQAPIWVVLVLTSPLPFWWGYRIVGGKAPVVGLCGNCQYDLRAHQPGDRCPECGHPHLDVAT